ncbi:carbohydrate ABC transporter permease [Leifsonia sp. 2MCAF36]|uniref:carbohydrate ABC transporter permease n=1 Tax=Leifsonia sp. 2MCAF36 TaxID=3232988 RepID=UPI003F9E3FEE
MAAKFSGTFGRNLFLVGAIVMFGFPIVWLLLAPTKTATELSTLNPFAFGSWSQFGLAAQHLFSYQGGIVWRWIGNSIFYTAASLVLALATAIPAGYALAKFRFRGRTAVLFTTLITMIVPPAALILPLYLEMSVVQLTNTPWSIILPLSFYPFGVYMIYLFATASMPDSLIEAARLDGCGELRIMMQIFAPIARPAIIMIAFFAIVASWTSFFLPYIMLTDPNLATVQSGLQLLVSGTGAIRGDVPVNSSIKAPEVALAAIVTILPILAAFLFAQKHLVAGQIAGAEKG